MVQEIEALLGRQSLADLDFAAVGMAARPQVLGLAARVNGTTTSGTWGKVYGACDDSNKVAPAFLAGRIGLTASHPFP